jgi:transcriptional regulator with XRE-family HTH domain
MSFGKTVREARRSRGWKQDVLANKVETSRNTISSIEQDQQIPRGKLLTRILTVLELSLDDATKGDPRFGGTLPSANDSHAFSKEELFRDLAMLMLEGELTEEEVQDELYRLRQERKRKGLE